MPFLLFTALRWRILSLSTFVGLSISHSAIASIASEQFSISAQVRPGCVFSSGHTNFAHFGTLHFGSHSSLTKPLHTTSTSMTGSIMIKCTPGTEFTIALDSGLHSNGAISQGRMMQLAGGNNKLAYQLYQDPNHRIVWGNSHNGGQQLHAVANGVMQQFPLHAALFATQQFPPAGQYSDTVGVTITY